MFILGNELTDKLGIDKRYFDPLCLPPGCIAEGQVHSPADFDLPQLVDFPVQEIDYRKFEVEFMLAPGINWLERRREVAKRSQLTLFPWGSKAEEHCRHRSP
jgi:hypothetical protein